VQLLNLNYNAGVSAMLVYFLVVQVRLTKEQTGVDRFSMRVELRNNGTLVNTTNHLDIPIDILDTSVNQVVYLPLTASFFFSSANVGIRVLMKGSNSSQIFTAKTTGTVQSAKR
jgi:hypothetical protein